MRAAGPLACGVGGSCTLLVRQEPRRMRGLRGGAQCTRLGYDEFECFGGPLCESIHLAIRLMGQPSR